MTPMTITSPTSMAHTARAGPPPHTMLRQWLMTGVSYMIPFVVTGGLLVATAYLLGGAGVAAEVNGASSAGSFTTVTDPAAVLDRAGYAGLLYVAGSATLFMLVPMLSGFIAYAMAGPLALVAGVVGGLLSTTTGAGYLGGLVSGLLAGTVVLLLRRLPSIAPLTAMYTVVLVPAVSTLLVGLAVLSVVGPPVAAVQIELTGALSRLSATHSVLLGLLLGVMVAIDMGGPVNKVAYTFALTSVGAGDGSAMAAVMAAGMTPPLALALASAVRPQAFTEAERSAGKAAWLLGASFITEGAIPFAVADPLRVIPALMAGSSVAGGLSMAAHASSFAPHGGLWVIALVAEPLLYLGAVIAGVMVGALCLVLTKPAANRAPTSG